MASLKNFQWNCNGLMGHINELQHHLALSSSDYDILCLQETFLKPEKPFSLSGYSAVRKDRDGSNSKGGLLTLVKDSLNYTEIDINVDIECIIVKIKTDNSYINVANIYLPPTGKLNVDDLNCALLPNTVLVGDFNAKNTLWGSTHVDKRGEHIENLLELKNFTVINNGLPTYTCHNGNSTHLDLALVCNSLAAKLITISKDAVTSTLS